MSRLIAIVAVLLLGLSPLLSLAWAAEETANRADKFAKLYEAGWLKDYAKRVKSLADDVAEHCKLDEAATKALHESCAPLVSAITQHWLTLYRGYFEAHVALDGKADFWKDYLALCMSQEAVSGRRELFAQWEALLAKQLSPTQLALWQQEMQERRKWRPRAREAAVKIQLESIAKEVTTSFEDRIESMTERAKLSKERAAALKPATEAAVAAHVAVRRPLAEKMALWCDEEFFRYSKSSLKAWENEGKMGTILGEEDAAEAADKAFELAWKKLATPDEQKLITEAAIKLAKRLDKAAEVMAAHNLNDMTSSDPTWELVAQVEKMASELDLDAARKKSLLDRAVPADKVCRAEWMKDATAQLKEQIKGRRTSASAMEAELKRMEDGNMWYSLDSDFHASATAKREAAWLKVIEGILKPEEVKLWAELRRQQSEEASRLLVLLSVAEADRKLRLLPDQRAKLEALAFEKVSEIKDASAVLTYIERYGLNGSMTVVAQLDDTSVAAFLDKDQISAFKEIKTRYSGYWHSLQRAMNKKP